MLGCADSSTHQADCTSLISQRACFSCTLDPRLLGLLLHPGRAAFAPGTRLTTVVLSAACRSIPSVAPTLAPVQLENER